MITLVSLSGVPLTLEHPSVRRASAHVPARVQSLDPDRRAVAVHLARSAQDEFQFARGGLLSVAGRVRLDNPSELSRLARLEVTPADDVRLVLETLERIGVENARLLSGPLALVIWDRTANSVTAIRDALGLRPLYYAFWKDCIAFSDRAIPLTSAGKLDRRYLEDFLQKGAVASDRSSFLDVAAVGAGSIIQFTSTGQRSEAYWSPSMFLKGTTRNADECADSFRELFSASVESSLMNSTHAWAELSGGLDSSAIVCVAEHCQTPEDYHLDGVVTFVDSVGGCNERLFADAVTTGLPVRKEFISDFWLWQAVSSRVRVPDQPRLIHPLWDRDRREAEILSAHGCDVLLSGLGADHYFSASLLFLADHLARGELTSFVRSVLKTAIASKRTFWQIAWQYGFRPLGPAPGRDANSLPPNVNWMRVVRNRAPSSDSPELAELRHRGRSLERYLTTITHALANIPFDACRSAFDGSLDIRYPFLCRRLVEFALQLPAALGPVAQCDKWVLREAMRGLVPEVVRSRRDKGSSSALLLRSLQLERDRLRKLVTAPILADLGLVDTTRLTVALDKSQQGDVSIAERLLPTLVLEEWLRAYRDARIGYPSIAQ